MVVSKFWYYTLGDISVNKNDNRDCYEKTCN